MVSVPDSESTSMQSPFPGMDPYIEACQLRDDFHHDLLLEIKGALAPQLPAGYVVRGSERTYLVMGPAEGQRQKHRFWSDVSVASTGTAAAGTATVSPAVPARPANKTGHQSPYLLTSEANFQMES